MGDDTKPFTIGQEDANCRNRHNTPGDLNNFYLVVSAEGKNKKMEFLPATSGNGVET